MTPAPTLDWLAPPLQAALQALRPALAVEVRAEDASTNTTLLARARGGQAEVRDCLLVAEHQSAGRGRLGRSWQAARGDSLTFSLALNCAPRDWAGLSLAVGVALADALDPLGLIGLKWPNDLWLRDDQTPPGRKLGGILIETAATARGRLCVVGVGLNVRARHFEGLDTGHACLQELEGSTSAPEVLHRVAAPLLHALARFEREGFAAFRAGFARRDLLRGRAVTTVAPGQPAGTAEGVDADGALLIRDDAHRLHRVVSGEVSVRPARRVPAAHGAHGALGARPAPEAA